MPADISGGWYLEICPDGLTPAAMQVLMGEHHHHHQGVDDQATNLVFCDLGAGFASDLLGSPYTSVVAVRPALDDEVEWLEHRLVSSSIWRAPARGPPRFV